MAHAKLSPSKAYQWAVCTASVGLVEALILDGTISEEDQGSAAAAQGTLRHDKAAQILLGKADESSLAKDEFYPVMEYVKECRKVGKDVQTFVEHKVPLRYSPKETGTLDFGCVSDDTVYIRDYKDGAGVKVESQNNHQMAIYALSFVDELLEFGILETPPDYVSMGIVQPNYRDYEGCEAWVISYPELLEFYEKNVAPGVFEIEAGTVNFRPGEHTCTFCRASKLCKAKAQARLADMPAELDLLPKDEVLSLAHMPARELTVEQVAAVLKVADPLREFLKEVEEMAREEMVAERMKIPGYKVVLGRPGNRAWTDEEAAAKFLKNFLTSDVLFEKSVISIAKAEKALKALPEDDQPATRGWNIFESLQTRAAGKPTLAPESDERPALASKAEKIADLPSTDDSEDLNA